MMDSHTNHNIDNVDASFKYDVFVHVGICMLQDSFADALLNKNCILRNKESHGPKFPLNPS